MPVISNAFLLHQIRHYVNKDALSGRKVLAILGWGNFDAVLSSLLFIIRLFRFAIYLWISLISVMEVTGDIDMSKSLQLVAKANIIITTVRKLRYRNSACEFQYNTWKCSISNSNVYIIAWEMGLSDAILATTFIFVGGYWSLTFGWSASSWRGKVHISRQ
jgi:hypothetical protein